LKIWLKRLLLGLLALLLVALGAITVFVLTFNPNSYKRQLQEFVQQHYQRTLSIDGDITLSVFPRIGLTLQQVSLSDRNSDKRFASVGNVQLTMALWPLLFRHVVVDHVSIADFRTWLQRDTRGRFNFDDLVRLPAAHVPQEGGTVLAGPGAVASGLTEPLRDASRTWRSGLQVDIAGLELRGGEIYFDDRYKKVNGHIGNLHLNTGRIADGQPFDVTVTGQLMGNQPAAKAGFEGQGRVSLSPLKREYAIERGRMTLKGSLAALQDAEITVQGASVWNTYLQTVKWSGLQLAVQGSVAGAYPMEALDLTLSMPLWKLDRSQADLRVSGLELRARGQAADKALDLAVSAPSLEISPGSARGEAVSGTFKQEGPDAVVGITATLDELEGDAYDVRFRKADLEAVFQEPARTLSLAFSSPLAWQVFKRQLSLSAIKGDADLQTTQSSRPDASFPFIGRLEMDGYRGTLKADLNSVVDGGSVMLNLEADKAAEPPVRFDLMGDRLNLNVLLPEPAAKEAKAGASDEDEKDATSDVRNAASIHRVTPLQWLTRFDFEGGVAVDRLEAGALEFQRVRAGLQSAQGQLRVNDVRASLYGGNGTARLVVGPRDAVEAEFAIEEANLGALSRDLWGQPRFSGLGAMHGHLMSHGQTVPALVSGLNGQLGAKASNGAILGMDVVRTIDEADNVLRNIFSNQLPAMEHSYQAGRRTTFDNWETQISFTNGQGLIERFDLQGPDARIRVGEPARLDLVNRQVELLFVARVAPHLGGPASQLREQDIPIRVSGPFDRPSYSVQWRDIHDPVVQDAIEDGLLEKLTDTTERAPGFLQLAPDRPDPSDSSSDSTDPIKRVGEALKGLLQK